MAYQYRMEQVPPNISVKSKDAKGQEAATYLQQIVNAHAKQGWEFFRVDTIGVEESPGCLSALFGAKTVFYNHYVITFRKQA